MKAGVIWLLVALAMGGCESVHTQAVPRDGEGAHSKEMNMAAKTESAPVVLDHAEARAQEGKWVAVKGTARDARIAAAVVGGDLVVFCIGLERWPDGMSGKPVLVHGRLELTREFVAQRGPGEEVSAGTDGPVWVLRDCRYESH